jgi:hypothetical protein
MTTGNPGAFESPPASTYNAAPGHRFSVGDRVVIKRSYPPGHRRTPFYIRGKRGVIERICGAFPNPEELAYGFDGEPGRVLYRVRFVQRHVCRIMTGRSRIPSTSRSSSTGSKRRRATNPPVARMRIDGHDRPANSTTTRAGLTPITSKATIMVRTRRSRKTQKGRRPNTRSSAGRCRSCSRKKD